MKYQFWHWARFSLSRKLLMLTIGVIVLAQLLILVPAATRFRENWLRQHLQMAETSALLLHVITPDDLTTKEWMRVFETLNIYDISVKQNGKETYIALNEDVPALPQISETVKKYSVLGDVRDMAGTLMYKGHRLLNVTGESGLSGGMIEITVLERPLYNALLAYIQDVLFSTFLLSICVGVALYGVLSRMFIRPLVKLNTDMHAFRADPESYMAQDHAMHRDDEIGTLARNFEALQQEIAEALKKKEYLATLGLAVAKISHDLRNILTAAQLMSDRIFMKMDDKTRDYLTQLVHTIDRAVELCQSTLIYGKLGALDVEKKPIELRPIIHELAAALDIEQRGIELVLDIPDGFTVNADPEYLYRIILNLARNAVHAMCDARPKLEGMRLSISAHTVENGVEINVSDTGPGIPPKLEQQLFKPFQSNANAGTGLGLAIVKELVEAHGGSIESCPVSVGAHFRMQFPL